ncbi:hypothetical protein FJZ36_13390 [Candidatus Poribacteria bacterium]|nr:hypothetical protein [Candidatus Poribacteria bacterium]
MVCDGSRLAVALLCVLSLAAHAQEQSADDEFDAALKALIDGDYSSAYDRYQALIELHPATPHARIAAERVIRLERLGLLRTRRRGLDQTGRTEALVFGTAYATWLGIGTTLLMDTDDEVKAATAGAMVGAPAGLILTHALTRSAKLSEGQAALVGFAGWWGTWQGLGAAILRDDDNGKQMIRGSIAGGLAGITAASAVTRVTDLTVGEAAYINHGGTWASILAALSLPLLALEGNDALAYVLIAGDLGVAATASTARRASMTAGRANLISLGGIVGMLASSGVLMLTEMESDDAISFTLILGSAAGLAYAWSATSPQAASPDAGGIGRLGAPSTAGVRLIGTPPAPGLALSVPF